MDAVFQTIDNIKSQFPNEWVLLGNPQTHNTTVVGGVVLFHDEDKRKVYSEGKKHKGQFARLTVTFAGNLQKATRLGILKRISE